MSTLNARKSMTPERKQQPSSADSADSNLAAERGPTTTTGTRRQSRYSITTVGPVVTVTFAQAPPAPKRRISVAGSPVKTGGGAEGGTVVLKTGGLTTTLPTIAVQSDQAGAAKLVGGAHKARVAGNIPAAEECLRAAIRADPECLAAWANLGNILCDYRHDFDGAERAYRAALKIDSTKAPVWFNLGHLMREKHKDDNAAKVAYRKAVECDPTHTQSWSNLGQLLEREGSDDQAERAYASAIKSNPQHAISWYRLGELRMKWSPKQGKAAWQKCIEADPKFRNDAKIRAALGLPQSATV
eukprot:m.78468 g.78468  ORF g.78468 m.78468 type:complete len:300 (-) comp19210_c0_seq1:52-951(-)